MEDIPRCRPGLSMGEGAAVCRHVSRPSFEDGRLIMALSQNMKSVVSQQVISAREVLDNPRSTESQKTFARFILTQWRSS